MLTQLMQKISITFRKEQVKISTHFVCLLNNILTCGTANTENDLKYNFV